MNFSIEIIEEDQDIIVCRKPVGIPVQSAKLGQQDMVSMLKKYRAEKKEEPQIYVVHRLDQPVEGVMVFAKHQKAAAALSRQIQEKSIDKYYHAVVTGSPNPIQGSLTDYLLRDGKTNTSKVVSAQTKGAKKATLHYKVLQSSAGLEENGLQAKGPEAQALEQKSLVEIRLETGRHHQIRVQMAHMGYPLVGDKKYNVNCSVGYLPIGLCSVGLVFSHPATGQQKEYFISPKGEAFQEFL